ncbi:AraC family transcriptional regulator [Chitinophaga sp.]|uniref:AraC family transcriptional regulator n=1 Tax=Chitinophaga sp. TaxID=1869181 RepID=UPI002F9398DC
MKKIPVRHIHATQKELNATESFGIQDIHTMLAGKDMVQELHRHDFYYILALKKGAGHHEIDFTPYPISNHTVFFMRPGQVHQLTLAAGSTGYMMQFNKDFYAPHDILRSTLSTAHYAPDAVSFQKLLTILKDIFQEDTDKQTQYVDVIKANMQIFFIELTRKNNSQPAPDGNLYIYQQLESFLALLEKHISEHKQVAQYADMLHLSTYQLNAITKTTLGKTCSETINEYMILEAKRNLLATSGQISQIADLLGYEDVSYFIRFFKKHTGHTPEAFRHHFK